MPAHARARRGAGPRWCCRLGRRRRVREIEEVLRCRIREREDTAAHACRQGVGGPRDLRPALVVEEPGARQVALEAGDGVAGHPGGDLLGAPVPRVVVGVRVGLGPVGDALDQRRAATGAGPCHGRAYDAVDGEHVVPVDADAGHAVADRLVGEGRRVGLASEGDADRVLVVHDDEHARCARRPMRSSDPRGSRLRWSRRRRRTRGPRSGRPAAWRPSPARPRGAAGSRWVSPAPRPERPKDRTRTARSPGTARAPRPGSRREPRSLRCRGTSGRTSPPVTAPTPRRPPSPPGPAPTGTLRAPPASSG